MTAVPDTEALIAALHERGLTIATAESLTGGGVCAALVDVAGASEVVKGAIVAYDADVKHTVLGVPRQVLRDAGPVSPQVARDMAASVRVLLEADVGVATTGVAGPQAHGGQVPGTVIIAVAFADAVLDQRFEFTGERNEVRAQAVGAVVEWVRVLVSGMPQARS